MSVDATVSAVADYQECLYRRRVVRLTLGVALSMAIAFGFGWMLSFVTPVLVVGSLVVPGPRPPVKALFSLPIVILVTFAIALFVPIAAMSWPEIGIPLILLQIFYCFYLLGRGSSQAICTWMLVGLLMIPVVGNDSIDMAINLTVAIFSGGIIAMAIVVLMYVLVPDPPSNEAVAPAPKAPTMPKGMAGRYALERTLILAPLLIWFLYSQETGLIKVLIFAGLLAMSPNLTAGSAAGMGLVLANLVAGIIAMIVYEVLVMVPSFLFLVMLFVCLAMLYGQIIFKGGKQAKLFASNFGYVILLTGMGTMPFMDEVDDQFYMRIIQIMMSAVYVVLALNILDQLSKLRADWTARRERKRTQHS